MINLMLDANGQQSCRLNLLFRARSVPGKAANFLRPVHRLKFPWQGQAPLFKSLLSLTVGNTGINQNQGFFVGTIDHDYLFGYTDLHSSQPYATMLPHDMEHVFYQAINLPGHLSYGQCLVA